MIQPKPVLPESRHFQLEQLAEGVYAAISIDGTGSMSNAGVIDLGETTLIFDTFATSQAAQDLRNAAEQLIRKPIGYVVNSHKHGDHVWGNQVFRPDAEIIATRRTREELLKRAGVSREEMLADVEDEIREMEAKFAEERDPDKRRSQAIEIATRREILTAIPTFERTMPTLTFEQQLTLYGSKRTVEVITYGGGHTESDAFVYLPDDQIVFMGDLLFVRSHPWIGDGDPGEWERILQRIEQLSFSIAVPGHGPLGGKADLEFNRHYVTCIVALAQECIAGELSLEEARGKKMAAPFESWEGAEVFDWNMEFLYSRKK